MLLSTVDAAFCENLLLERRLPSTTIAALGKKLIASKNARVTKLTTELGLADPDQANALYKTAEQAVTAAGSLAFSFSKGAFVGPWELLDSRGAAPGGSHYAAKHESTGQSALLRLIEPGTTADPQRLQRLKDRANAGAPPPHPGILKIDEVGEDFGWLYTVTHDTDAWNLSSRLAQGPLHESEALPLMRRAAEALAVAHGFQVVHAGLSPLSMLMNQQGAMFLTDFGVGSVHMDGPPAGQRPGARLGTLLYAAPELTFGKAAQGIDPRSDIYALGALIFDCLLHPNGPRENGNRYPWEFSPIASENVKVLLSRCLARDPGGRYTSFNALIEDIDRIIAGTTPATLPPPPPSPPFLAARGPEAVPQGLITAATMRLAFEGTTSEEELHQRSQAGQDFLAAVAAAADAPEVPDGYQQELFNNPPTTPASGSQASSNSRSAVIPNLEAAQAGKSDDPSAEAGEGEGGGEDGGEDGGDGEGDSEEQDGASGSRKSKTLKSKPQAKGPKLEGPKRSERVPAASAARTRRTDRPAQSSAFSVTSLLLLCLIVGGVGAGAAASRKANELPAKEQIVRRLAYTEVLTAGQRFQEAILCLDQAFELAERAPLRAVMDDRRREINAAARAHYESEREAIFAGGDDREIRLEDARRRYEGTEVASLLQLDRARRLGAEASSLAQIGQELFGRGDPEAAVTAFETSLERARSVTVTSWLNTARAATSMVFVPAGSIAGEAGSVRVPAFYIDRTEVSRASWRQWLGKLSDTTRPTLAEMTPADWSKETANDNLPVTNISIDQALAFAASHGKRLPSAVEMQLAALGRGPRRFPWGEGSPNALTANLAGGFGRLAPVGAFASGATPRGVVDLLGNAAEWCAADKKIPATVFGGSFETSLSDISAALIPSPPPAEGKGPRLGFRCVLEAQLGS